MATFFPVWKLKQAKVISICFPAGVYFFGLFSTDIFVNAGQLVTGSLAPHFLSVCQPNYTALGCEETVCFISQSDACTGDPGDVMKARKSFPSKEAALSLYAAVYLGVSIPDMGFWSVWVFEQHNLIFNVNSQCLNLPVFIFSLALVPISKIKRCFVYYLYIYVDWFYQNTVRSISIWTVMPRQRMFETQHKKKKLYPP